MERITGLDAAGAMLREIAAATGVSTFSVRNALGRVAAGGRRPAAGAAEDSAVPGDRDDDADQGAVPVLPDPVPRDGERALARWGLLGEGATRVPPAALGWVLGRDRAPEVKTIRRKLAELAAAGKAAGLIMALARRHAAARPDALGFLHVDGHRRTPWPASCAACSLRCGRSPAWFPRGPGAPGSSTC